MKIKNKMNLSIFTVFIVSALAGKMSNGNSSLYYFLCIPIATAVISFILYNIDNDKRLD